MSKAVEVVVVGGGIVAFVAGAVVGFACGCCATDSSWTPSARTMAGFLSAVMLVMALAMLPILLDDLRDWWRERSDE